MIFYTADNYNLKKIKISGLKTHGLKESSIYKTWTDMKRRCLDRKRSCYKDYGGRGIGVCDRWISFDNFYQDMGDKPQGFQLDRIDNEKGYCKENCRWSSISLNSANRRSPKRVLKVLRGVYVEGNRFRSTIRIEGKSFHLGCFSTEIEASHAYLEIYKEWYGQKPPGVI